MGAVFLLGPAGLVAVGIVAVVALTDLDLAGVCGADEHQTQQNQHPSHADASQINRCKAPAGDYDAIDYVAAHALFYWAGGLFGIQILVSDPIILLREKTRCDRSWCSLRCFGDFKKAVSVV
jgi:hypothetical protein